MDYVSRDFDPAQQPFFDACFYFKIAHAKQDNLQVAKLQASCGAHLTLVGPGISL